MSDITVFVTARAKPGMGLELEQALREALTPALDARIVRAVLLPASMKLLGERNW